jgi:hypothetical protein
MEQGKTNIKLLQLSVHRNLRQQSMPMHQQLRHPQPNHPRLRQSLRSNGPRMRQKQKACRHHAGAHFHQAAECCGKAQACGNHCGSSQDTCTRNSIPNCGSLGS